MLENDTIVVFVLGGPGIPFSLYYNVKGAGKGTQCSRIVQEFGFVHLSGIY